jgi:hypothetical protein
MHRHICRGHKRFETVPIINNTLIKRFETVPIIRFYLLATRKREVDYRYRDITISLSQQPAIHFQKGNQGSNRKNEMPNRLSPLISKYIEWTRLKIVASSRTRERESRAKHANDRDPEPNQTQMTNLLRRRQIQFAKFNSIL